MAEVSKIEDLKLAVELGRDAIQRHRRLIDALVEDRVSPATIQLAREKLEAIEEVHAEDLAELERLTTN